MFLTVNLLMALSLGIALAVEAHLYNYFKILTNIIKVRITEAINEEYATIVSQNSDLFPYV